MSRHVDYYFSFASPFSCLGHREFIAVAGKHDLAVRYRPVALSEIFPQSGGLPLAKRHPLRQRYRLLELQRWRERRQVPLQLHPKYWPFDPALADRVVVALAAEAQPVENFLPGAFAAVYENDQNLGDETVIGALLGEAGFDDGGVLQHAKSDACGAAYAANVTAALAAGVFGAPSYVLDGELFWGQDRIELLDSALTSGREAYRADA